jgi:hypothetical protein
VVGELNDEYPAVKRSWSREGATASSSVADSLSRERIA